MDSFPVKTWARVSFETFNPKVYFIQYHHWEIYDEKKSYGPDYHFEKDFGEGQHTYEYNLYVVFDDNAHKEFVVARSLLSEQERTELLPYCPCNACKKVPKMWGATLYKLLTHLCYGHGPYCAECLGCICSMHPTEFNIYQARKDYKNCKEDKTNKKSI